MQLCSGDTGLSVGFCSSSHVLWSQGQQCGRCSLLAGVSPFSAVMKLVEESQEHPEKSSAEAVLFLPCSLPSWRVTELLIVCQAAAFKVPPSVRSVLSAIPKESEVRT